MNDPREAPAAPAPGPAAPAPAEPPVKLRSEARGVSAHAAFASGAGGRHEADARRRVARTPAFVLGAALALSTAAAVAAAVTGRARDAARFDNAVQDARDRVVARVDIYTALLYGARALFETSDSMSAAQFRTYVQHLDLERQYPGIRGIGFSRLLSAPGARPGTVPDSATLTAELRAGGSPALRLWPSPAESARAEYHAIVYLEPLDERNVAALGFDMYSEPSRRAAMQRARDTGTPAASALVTLKQEIEVAQQPGLLVYLPVYAGGAPPATVDQRRRALRGFVYAPMRAGDLFADIFGSEEHPAVALRVFDGPDTSAAALLFDSRTLASADRDAAAGVRRFVRTDALSIAGRRWTLAYAPLPASGVGTGTTAALWIGLFGVGVSAALFYATRAEVRARQDAERSHALRTRFFAAMSHELRTPLNAIMGYNDLIVAGIYGPISDEQRYGIERSQGAARHLLELVNDVLDVSKLEAGKVEVVSEDVDLDALLDDLLVTIAPVAEERGCVLRLDRAKCGVVLRTDPRRLRQILLNLLSNATKFAPGGLVTVRCEPLPHGNMLPGDHRGGERRRTSGDAVVIAVSDQGPGIAPADHERIFEEFVQLPSPTAGGTGLGLPISRRLAELLGGTLSLSSTLGRGSTFFVTLPSTPRRERVRGLTLASKA